MAEKEVVNVIKLQIEAAKASPAPPVGLLLGPIGLVGGALGKKKVTYYYKNCQFQRAYDD